MVLSKAAALRCCLIAVALLTAAVGAAGALTIDEGLRKIASNLAQQMLTDRLGMTRPVDIMIATPRDYNYGVLCTPLSRVVRRKFRAPLKDILHDNRQDLATLVSRFDEGGDGDGPEPRHFVAVLSWRKINESEVEVAVAVGDRGEKYPSSYFDQDETVSTKGLNRLEERCLFDLEEIGEVISVDQPIAVYNSIGNFNNKLAEIEAGVDFRLLGRIRDSGNWALVEILEHRQTGPGAENRGFAIVPRTGETAAELQSRLRKADERIARLSEERKAAKDKLAGLEGLPAEIDRLESETRDLREALADREAALSEAAGRIESLRRQTSELRGEIGELESTRDSLRSTVETLRRRLSNAESGSAELATAERRIKLLEGILEQRQAALARRERDLKTAREDLSEARRENRSLRDRLAKLDDGGSSSGGTGGFQLSSPQVQVHQGVDFDNSTKKWLDLDRVNDVSHQQCKDICLRDAQCKHYTYNTRHNVCFTKAGVAVRNPYKYAVSGTIAGR